MATQLQIRRGSDSQVSAFTGAEGEIVVNTTNSSVHVNNGSTAGGFELARVDGSNWNVTNNISTTGSLTAAGLTVDTTTLVVDATNNRVGIGTSSLSTKLEVLDANGIGLRFGDVAAAPSSQTAGFIGMSTSAFSGNNGDLVLYPRTSAASNILLMGGNVGIGASSPGAKLEAAGNLRITNATVANSAIFQVTSDATGSNGVNLEATYYGSGGFGPIKFTTSNTERMRIDASGRVGIDVVPESWFSSYSALQIGASGALSAITSGNENVGLSSNTYLATDGNFKYIATNEATRYLQSAGVHYWYSAASGTADTNVSFSQNMTLDSSGNLLVGKTSTSTSTAGMLIGSNGRFDAVRDGGYVGYFNRLTNDGDIAIFAKDGAPVGSIGTDVGTITIDGGSTAAGILSWGGTRRFRWIDSFYPDVDNQYDLGLSVRRFDDIFATNGTIQTSDRNEKQDIEALSDAEQRVAVAAKGLLRKFRWIDSVEAKGDDARIHFGIIAQDLQDAFTAEGLDAGRYAMFINSTWTDEETGEERSRMGVRYSELLAFIISAI